MNRHKALLKHIQTSDKFILSDDKIPRNVNYTSYSFFIIIKEKNIPMFGF